MADKGELSVPSLFSAMQYEEDQTGTNSHVGFECERRTLYDKCRNSETSPQRKSSRIDVLMQIRTGIPVGGTRNPKQKAAHERVCDEKCGRCRYTICKDAITYRSGALKSQTIKNAKQSDHFVISDQNSFPLDFQDGQTMPCI